MADYDGWEEEEVEGGGGDGFTDWGSGAFLEPLGITLGLLSCGVVATVLLGSNLRRAAWAAYLLLWAASLALLMVLSLVGFVVAKVARAESASSAGCVVFFYLLTYASFLESASVTALSLHVLVSVTVESPPSWLCGRRGALYASLGLLLGVLVLYCPILNITGVSYHNMGGHLCLAAFEETSTSRHLFHVYLHVSAIAGDLLGSLVVCAGLGGLWWDRRRSSENLRLLGPFLLGFFLLCLPETVFSTIMIYSLHEPMPEWLLGGELYVFHTIVRVCTYVKPVVLLGCLSTSLEFRTALKYAFRPPFYRRGRDNPGFMTEMTEVEGDT